MLSIYTATASASVLPLIRYKLDPNCGPKVFYVSKEKIAIYAIQDL